MSVCQRSTSSVGVLISLVSDILLAIILAGLESSILVEHNSTVNAGNPRSLFRLEEGSAVVMAVTTAQSGRHSRCVAFKQGTSGQPAGEKKFFAE